jgi:hypothetical protein
MRPILTQEKLDGTRQIFQAPEAKLDGFQAKKITVKWNSTGLTSQQVQKSFYRTHQDICQRAAPLVNKLDSKFLIVANSSGLSNLSKKLCSVLVDPKISDRVLYSLELRHKTPVCNTETPEKAIAGLLAYADPSDSQYSFTLITHADPKEVIKLQQRLNQYAEIPTGMPSKLNPQFWLYAIQNGIIPENWDNNHPFDPFDL